MCNFFGEFRRLFYRDLHRFSQSCGLHQICSLEKRATIAMTCRSIKGKTTKLKNYGKTKIAHQSRGRNNKIPIIFHDFKNRYGFY